MDTSMSKKTRRKVVRKTFSTQLDQSAIECEPLFYDSDLMLKIEPRLNGVKLADWMSQNAGFVKDKIHQHGALLFRGFGLTTDSEFLNVTDKIPFERIDASVFEESTPRKKISDGLYTTTLFPSEESIFLHSDYSPSMCIAGKLSFFCLIPPVEDGETPFADSRRILKDMDPGVREKFRKLGWQLVRNYRAELGLAWEDTFFGKNEEQIHQHCIERNIELEWNDGVPRTKQTRSAIMSHRETGEEAWFNHIAFWHIANLPAMVRDSMLGEVGEEGMPFNTYYGDGSKIPDEIAQYIYQLQLDSKRKFRWQVGDLVLADNILTCHGREPFKGERIIRVSLFDRFNRPEFEVGS